MDPRDVFKSDELLEFWPTATQSARERVSATTRFVLYAMCIVFLLNKDPRVFALGALVLAILYYLWSSNMISDGKMRAANEYVDNPDRPSAAWYPSVRTQVQQQMSAIHPFERQRDAERNFYTVAGSTIPNDQTGFAQAAYGKPFAPKCHDQGGAACNPDRFYSTFPERVQMEAGNGR